MSGMVDGEAKAICGEGNSIEDALYDVPIQILRLGSEVMGPKFSC